MSVWCNRWYNEGFTALVLITGWEFFCIKIQKGTGHVSIRDVVKLKNTTSPNKKEEEEMYQKVSTDLKFVDREKKTEKFWADNKIFEKSMENRKEGETYTFYDGPPTANGKPHIGHVLTRVIKDMIPRYRTMKGYMVPRKAGWETHGLPVELEV